MQQQQQQQSQPNIAEILTSTMQCRRSTVSSWDHDDSSDESNDWDEEPTPVRRLLIEEKRYVLLPPLKMRPKRLVEELAPVRNLIEMECAFVSAKKVQAREERRRRDQEYDGRDEESRRDERKKKEKKEKSDKRSINEDRVFALQVQASY